MMALLTDEQVMALWNGMFSGVTARGTAGSADRAALARAIGLDWYGAALPRSGRGDPKAGAAVAGKLERALNRVAAASRHAAVTDDEDEGAEPAADGASEGDAHKIEDHVLVEPGEAEEGGDTPPPSRVGQDHPTEQDGVDLEGE